MRKGGDLREYGNALSGGGYALETRWEDPFTRSWGAEGERRGITRPTSLLYRPLTVNQGAPLCRSVGPLLLLLPPPVKVSTDGGSSSERSASSSSQ